MHNKDRAPVGFSHFSCVVASYHIRDKGGHERDDRCKVNDEQGGTNLSLNSGSGKKSDLGSSPGKTNA